MCTINFPIHERKQPFDLEKELTNTIGKKRANEVVLLIKNKFENVFPIQAESLAFSGNARFNKEGKLITDFNHNEELYNYLVTFRKTTLKKTIKVDETFFYVFN